MAAPLSVPPVSTELASAGLARPALPLTGRERVRAEFEGWRQRRAARQRWEPPEPQPAEGSTKQATSNLRSREVGPVGLVVGAGLAGAVLVVAVFAAWTGWSTWSQRSTPAVETLIPRAVPAVVLNDSGTSSDNAAAEVSSLDAESLDEPADASADEGMLLVHVAGAVVQPGVVGLQTGDRVVDAVAEAGGPTEVADLDRVNLAAVVVDGQHLVVPKRNEPVPALAPQPTSARTSAGGVAATAVIDINQASAQELEALSGVGPAIAAAIVSHREESGGFLTPDELLNVAGIGPAKFAAVEAQVSVG